MEATTRLLRGRTLRGDSWRPTPCNRAEISTPAGLTISLSWVDGSMDSMVPGFLKLAGCLTSIRFPHRRQLEFPIWVQSVAGLKSYDLSALLFFRGFVFPVSG